MEHWLIVLVTVLLVGLSVGLHYEALERLNDWLPRWRLPVRQRVLFLIFSILLVHTVEIWIFGIGIYGVLLHPPLGHVEGQPAINLLDAVYLLASCFTTSGDSGLIGRGPMRLIMGTEALTGFVLITWSASFTFLEMQRYWRPR